MGDLLAGVDGFPLPADPVFERLPRLGEHGGHVGLGGLLRFGQPHGLEIGRPQRLTGGQFRVAAAGRSGGDVGQVLGGLCRLAVQDRRPDRRHPRLVGHGALRPALGGVLGEAENPAALELAVLTRRGAGQQPGVGEPGDVGALLPLQAVGVSPGKELAQHRRVVVVAHLPIQVRQAPAEDVQFVDLHVVGGVGQGEAEALQGLAAEPLHLRRLQVRLLQLLPGLQARRRASS